MSDADIKRHTTPMHLRGFASVTTKEEYELLLSKKFIDRGAGAWECPKCRRVFKTLWAVEHKCYAAVRGLAPLDGVVGYFYGRKP